MKLKTEPKSPKSEKGEKRGEVIINEKNKNKNNKNSQYWRT